MIRASSYAGVSALSAMMVTALTGCASAPANPVHDRLDTQTATTVTVMQAPVELTSDTPAADPFAYVAPFETDRMGERALYLWISVPQVSGPVSEPKVTCDGHPLSLQAIGADLAQFSLSRPPYTLPAPWSGQWYFKLPHESLQCLGTAQGIALDTQATQGPTQTEHFSASGKALAELQAFAVAQRDTGAARR
jgi:hypothetical protein